MNEPGRASRGTAPRVVRSLRTVGTGGLAELAEGDDVELVGDPGSHSSRFWGTAGMVAALESLGAQFFGRYGVPIGVNDMSLPLGGLFDINGNWHTPHDEHRIGANADLRTRDSTPAKLRFIQDAWEELGGSVHDETRTDAPHYHLRF